MQPTNRSKWSFLLALVLVMGGMSMAHAQDDWGDDDWGDDDWGDDSGDSWGDDSGETGDSWSDDSGETGDSWGDAGESDDGGYQYEEPAAPAVEVAQDPQMARSLQEGIEYYENDNWLEASIYFWRVADNYDPSADSLRPRAQFELAKTLVKLQLFQGALIFFDEIIAEGPAHPYFEASAPWLVVIARRLPGDVEMLRRVSAFSDLWPDRIEEKYREEMAYQLGQHFYNQGELELALQYLSVVTEISTFYPQALFLSAITHVRLYEAEPALGRLSRLREITERTRDDDLRDLRELAQLSMARTYYSAGDYDNAIGFYGDMTQDSNYWLDALFESSWAYFQIDEYNRALGNLHSLNSPFFNDEYYPEAPILQSVIFFYNCRYDEVRATIDEFNYIYPPVLTELDLLLDELDSNEDFYYFLEESESESESARDFDPRLAQIVDATLSDNSIRETKAFIEELQAELAFIDGADPGWSNSDLATFLYGEIATTLDYAIIDGGELVRNRLENIREELAQQDRDARAILVETDLAEAGILDEDLSLEQFRGGDETSALTVHPEQMYWEFEGEYWKDELGYYYYHINSRCAE